MRKELAYQLTIERRVKKLEAATEQKRARSKKPFVGSDWTAEELVALISTWPDYPANLKKKHSLTEWPTIAEEPDDELLARRLRKLTANFNINADAITARLSD